MEHMGRFTRGVPPVTVPFKETTCRTDVPKETAGTPVLEVLYTAVLMPSRCHGDGTQLGLIRVHICIYIYNIYIYTLSLQHPPDFFETPGIYIYKYSVYIYMCVSISLCVYIFDVDDDVMMMNIIQNGS